MSGATFCRLLVFTFLLTATSGASDNYTSFVFKRCSQQTFSNNIYPPNLKPLMDSLVSNSSLIFFSAASTDGADAINGVYQCRGDLSKAECYNCVSSIPSLLGQLCGEANAAQVQLQGCYMRYEAAVSDSNNNPTEFLFKRCGAEKSRVVDQVEKRDVAFRQMIGNVRNSSGALALALALYGASSYESVNVMGQCEGTLANEECVKCLHYASQKIDCGNSASGQTYLYKCWIGFSSSNASANGGDGGGDETYARKANPCSCDQRKQKPIDIVLDYVLLVVVLGNLGLNVVMVYVVFKERHE